LEDKKRKKAHRVVAVGFRLAFGCLLLLFYSIQRFICFDDARRPAATLCRHARATTSFASSSAACVKRSLLRISTGSQHLYHDDFFPPLQGRFPRHRFPSRDGAPLVLVLCGEARVLQVLLAAYLRVVLG